MNDPRHSRSVSRASINTANSSDNLSSVVVGDTKRKLTSKFITAGVIAICLIVTLLSAGGYYVVRSSALQSTIDRVADEMRAKVLTRVQADQVAARPEVQSALGKALAKISSVEAVALYDSQRKQVWSSAKGLELSQRETDQFSVVSSGRTSQHIFDRNLFSPAGWSRVFSGDSSSLPALVSLKDSSGRQVGVAKLLINSDRDLRDARNFGIGLFLAVLLATLSLFALLYKNFKKGVQTIEDQEQEMNHQITRLSNLLTINKSMQNSIKTASARAVELNEQFLRRTGADLHDGPAQMISFANMRLNKLSKDESVKALGHEFHAIREALDESLEEIRGISSGLVLPELASMTFEQCLRKVVLLHGTKSDAEVTQTHSEMPMEVPLPVKICAYRFVQEGLNNAERHGKAEKCRLRTSFRDGVIEVSLKDNGMGFRKSQLSTDGGHLGLMGLKDRIESLGGKFNINSELGVGTALKFSIDLNEDG